MLRNKIRLIEHIFASPVYAPQSEAVFAQQSPQMSDAYKAKVDVFIRFLLNIGVWNRLFLLPWTDPNGKVINLRNPAVACTITGTPIVTPGRSVKGNGGASDGFTTGYSQADILQDDIFYGVFSVSDANSTGSAGAAIGVSASSRMFPSASRTVLTRLNGGAGSSVSHAVNNSIGLKAVARNNSATVDLYDGQAQYLGVTSASSGTGTGALTVCYVSTSAYLGEVFMAVGGRYIPPVLVALLNTAIEAFAASIGVGYTASIVGNEPAGTSTSGIAFFHNGRIPLSGTVIATALNLQVKITEEASGNTVVDWTTIVAGISTGSFDTAITGVPQSGFTQPYKREYRFSDLSFATARSSTSFYTGEIIELDGESLQNHSYSVIDTPGTSVAGAMRLSNGVSGGAVRMDSALVVGEYGSSGPFGGDASVLWGNVLVAGLGVPVCALQFARGGTETDVWIRLAYGGAPDPTQEYANYGERAAGSLVNQQAAPGVYIGGTCFRTGINHILRGKNGAQMTTLLTNYVLDKRALHNDPNYPIWISPVGRAETTKFTDAAMDDVRQAMLAFIDANAGNNVHHGGAWLQGTLVDEYHLNLPGRLQADVTQDRAIEETKGTKPYGAAGPKPVSISAIAGNQYADVTFTHNGGTALWDRSNNPAGTGITGFRLFRNGVALTITGAAITSATVVRLTFSETAWASSQTAAFDYFWGKVSAAQIVNPLFDDDVVTSSVGGLGKEAQPSRGQPSMVVA